MVWTIQFSRHLRLNTADTSFTHYASRMTHALRSSLILITVCYTPSPHLPVHLPHRRTPRILNIHTHPILTTPFPPPSTSYRIVFRIIEFTSVQGGPLNIYINRHEFFVYVFDALSLFFALVLMNFWHLGKVLVVDGGKVAFFDAARFYYTE